MAPRARHVGILLALLVALPATVLAATSSVIVVNAAPVVTSAALPSTTVLPTSGGTTTVTATIVVTDLNGCNDLSSVVAEVLKPSGAAHVASASATYVSCAAGTAATYTYAFPMRFYDGPAALDAGYKLRVTATDRQAASGTNAASLLAFAYAELAALQLDLGTIDFGASVSPGARSTVLPLGVQNVGNVPVDTQLAGTPLAHASEDASIAVSSVSYSTASDMANAAELGASASTLASFDLATGASSSRSLYWQLAVPSGETQWVPSGVYAGTVTVSAVKG